MNEEKRSEIKKAIRFGYSDDQIATIECVTYNQVAEIRNEMAKEEQADD